MLRKLTMMVLALMMLGVTAEARYWYVVPETGVPWLYAYSYTGNFESDDATGYYPTQGLAAQAFNAFWARQKHQY